MGIYIGIGNCVGAIRERKSTLPPDDYCYITTEDNSIIITQEGDLHILLEISNQKLEQYGNRSENIPNECR